MGTFWTGGCKGLIIEGSETSWIRMGEDMRRDSQKLLATSKFRSVVGLAFLTLLVGCTCSQKPIGGEVVASVGDYQILVQDLKRREIIEQFYYPDRDPKELALPNLIKGFTYAQILANYGREITADKLRVEHERMRKNSQMPEKLIQLETLVGAMEPDFHKVFVLPLLAQSQLYFEFFQKDGDTHAATREKALQFLAQVQKNPKAFDVAAKEFGAKVTPFSVSRTKGLNWGDDGHLPFAEREVGHPLSDTPRFLAANPGYRDEEGERWFKDVIEVTGVGKIHDKIIDQQSTLVVIKNMGKKNKRQILKAAHFEKQNYDEWLKEETEKVSVTINPNGSAEVKSLIYSPQ